MSNVEKRGRSNQCSHGRIRSRQFYIASPTKVTQRRIASSLSPRATARIICVFPSKRNKATWLEPAMESKPSRSGYSRVILVSGYLALTGVNRPISLY